MWTDKKEKLGGRGRGYTTQKKDMHCYFNFTAFIIILDAMENVVLDKNAKFASTLY